MLGIIHILVGVIVNRLFKWRHYAAVGMVFIFVLCLLLHGIFDKLSIIAYRQYGTDFADPFWLIYHISAWLTGLVLIYVFWRDYKWGILFSLLPDIDWVILGIQNVLHISVPFYNRPWIHEGLNYILDNTPPFYYLNNLPDNGKNPFACLWELLIIALLALIMRVLFSHRKNIHFK